MLKVLLWSSLVGAVTTGEHCRDRTSVRVIDCPRLLAGRKSSASLRTYVCFNHLGEPNASRASLVSQDTVTHDESAHFKESKMRERRSILGRDKGECALVALENWADEGITALRPIRVSVGQDAVVVLLCCFPYCCQCPWLFVLGKTLGRSRSGFRKRQRHV